MPKRILTQEDFNNNPILPELGLKVGDEVEIPETTEEQTQSDETTEEGGDHPGHKPQTP